MSTSSTASAASAAQQQQGKPPKIDDADLQAVENLKQSHAAIKAELAKVIIGQDQVIDEILISIFTRSHALLASSFS